MTSWHRHDLPLDAPFTPGLARLLRRSAATTCRPGGAAGRALQLAAARAARRLQRRRPLLRLTLGRLAADHNLRLGIDAAPTVPHRHGRGPGAAPGDHRLGARRPGAAAGLAEELVRLFDELRRWPGSREGSTGTAPGPAADHVARRGPRGRAWRLHRRRARDDVDRSATSSPP
jgi:hypothetical protein